MKYIGILEEALKRDESFNAIRDKVDAALTRCIRAGIDMDCDGDGPQDTCDYAWVQDLYPSIVVYSMNGCLYQADYSIDANDNVTFGTPKEVEITYSPVGESARLLLASVEGLRESAYNTKTGEFPIKIIEAGTSKNKKHYPADVLKRDFKIFEGAKMFADHQTDAEAKSRPEGSVHNWVANLKNVYAESDGSLHGTAVVIDPQFKAKLDTLAEKGMLKEMGISIRAVGAGYKQVMDNEEVTYVESLVACRSVDFVTFAGAGGQVEAMESVTNEFDLDLVSEAQLRERRPDLVQLIESKKETPMQKTLEQQLQEAQQEIATLKADKTTLNTKLQEAEKANRKAAAATELTKLLKESKLPEKAKDRLRKQFAEAEKPEGMKEAIEAEEAYIKDLGVSGAVTSRRNLGAAENEVREGADKGKTNLIESFKSLGLNDKEAELAATGAR